jgi:photosystem II stability/assembly factor-like uncharacterized protein
MRPLTCTFALLLGCSHAQTPIDAALPPAPDLAGTQLLSASWQKLAKAPSIAGKQDDLYFIDANQGWSINGQGQIFHTADGGATWDKELDQPGTYFRAVTFLDEKHGLASNIGTGYYPGVTDATPLYRTDDGGGTWKKVTAISGPTPKGICNFSRIDATHVVASGRVGGPSFLLRSSDGGASWQSIDLSSQVAMLIDARFKSFDDGLVTGGDSLDDNSRCVILHTADGGASWQTVFTSQGTGEACWKLSFPSDRVGYASVLTFGNTPSSFIKTTDGGATWQELPFIDGSYAALGVGFITEDIGWIGGEASSKPPYRTTDGGQTWIKDPSLGPYINRFRFIGTEAGYAIGSTIYKLVVQ